MKKGFTLAELIAVLVVLALVSMIAVPAVTDSLKKYKGEVCEVQMTNIVEAARSWGAKNLTNLPNIDGDYITVPFSDLIKYGFIDESLVDPKTKEAFSDEWEVRITKQSKKYIYDIYNDSNLVDISSYCG